ncbi:hypothetical protein Tco_0158308 [Tanacetum coccineum]
MRSSRSYLGELMVSFLMLRKNLMEPWLLFLLLLSSSWTRYLKTQRVPLQAFSGVTFDKVVPSRKKSSAIISLRANTHGRHSTSSSRTFGHTSTLEHLKKKKSVETGAPSAA